MKQREANKLLRGFKQAFSEQTVTEIGRATGFFRRERKMTPMKMVMSLMSCFAGGQGTTLADVQRSYNALSLDSMAYKPFHNQLSKAAFARFMRELASHVLSTLVVEVLKPARAGLLSEFGRVLVQDGSSFAVKDARHRTYPGLFTTVSPAAMEDLVAQPTKPGKRGPAPKLQQQMERISQLPRPKQRFVLEVLEAALVQASR